MTAHESSEPSDPTRRRVRLVDVAERAGVTKATASRVLNGDATLSVRPDTRARVLEAAETLAYRPHAGARALTQGQTRALALLIPDLTNLTYSRIVRGAFRRASERGYVLLIAEDATDLGDDEPGEWDGSRARTDFSGLVDANRVDGLIVASARSGDPIVETLARQHVPHVFVNRAVPGSGRNVTMDVAAASRLAIEHLTDLGHRRIGHIAGPADITPAREREDAFLLACAELGVEHHPVLRADFSAEAGHRAAHALLDEEPTLTALYVSTYVQAIGVTKALGDRGVRIPADVSVVAFDDLPLADFLSPSLTTVAMPLTTLGAAAVDALVDQLEGGAPADAVLTPPPRLVRRESSGAPPTAIL